MKLVIVAVGQRIPDWAQTAYDDYAKRFPPELRVDIKAVKTEPRGSKTTETVVAAERERIVSALPKACRTVVLDERGTPTDHQGAGPSTAGLAAGWRRRRLGDRWPRRS
jgi:23S rRNA (pseudouridine1915-N3)-methyltransferase